MTPSSAGKYAIMAGSLIWSLAAWADPEQASLPANHELVGVKLKGPFKSIKAYCRQQDKENNGHGCRVDPAWESVRLPKQQPANAAQGAAAILAIQILSTDNDNGDSLDLAINTAAGWYVASTGLAARSDFFDLKITESALHQNPGSPGSTLFFRYTINGTNPSDRTVTKEERLILCGIGKSGTPSCIPAIMVNWLDKLGVTFDSKDEPLDKPPPTRIAQGKRLLQLQPGERLQIDEAGHSETYQLRFP